MTETTYILLFRGINVGGNKKVPMEILRAMLAGAGFKGVKTYIQSGNAVFRSDMDEPTIIETVERLFPETFGFASRPTLRSAEAWRQLIDANPFPEAAGNQLHAVVLDASPTDDAFDRLEALASTEQLAMIGGVLYLFTPDGFGRSVVAEKLDQILKTPLTARNWNTVLKLQELAEATATG